ncbi:hypothetical protein FKM82_024783, partial [Ascaphus truei]
AINPAGHSKCLDCVTSAEFMYRALVFFVFCRDGRVLGVLEVSRSLGDGQYKRCGVISTPDVKRCPLTPSDRFVLLACDGLFKAFSPEEAVTFILTHVQEESPPVEEGLCDLDAPYESACQRLATEAVRRGAADNVTVLLVHIQH